MNSIENRESDKRPGGNDLGILYLASRILHPGPLNTNEHDLFTYPRYAALRSFTSLWSLRNILGDKIIQTVLKNEHEKTQKNTHRIARSHYPILHHSTSPILRNAQ